MKRQTTVGLVALAVAMLIYPAGALGHSDSSRALVSMPGEVGSVALGPDSRGVVIARGRLSGLDGTPAAGEVAALAWPNSEILQTLRAGELVPMTTVGWVHVARDGKFALQVDPALVGTRYRGSGDYDFVNVSLVGWASGSQGTWAATGSLNDARTGAPGSEAAPDEVSLRVNAPIHARATSSVTGPVSQADVSPAAGGCYQYYTGVSYNAWDIMAETWPYGSHTGDVTLTSGHVHTLGVAVSLSGTYGTFSYNGSNSVSTTTTDHFGPSVAYRNYQMETQYGRYNSNCGGVTVKSIKALGYYQNQSLTGYPNWTHCGPVVGEWSRDLSTGNAYTVGAGVKLGPYIGLDVSSSTQYSSTRVITYYHAGSYHVCGNDDDASSASKVESAF